MRIIVTILMTLVFAISVTEAISQESYSKSETIIFTNTSPVITQTVATVVISGEIIETDRVVAGHMLLKMPDGTKECRPMKRCTTKIKVITPSELRDRELTILHDVVPDSQLNELGIVIRFKVPSMAIIPEDDPKEIVFGGHGFSPIGRIEIIKSNHR